jgi:hypothetical protein
LTWAPCCSWTGGTTTWMQHQTSSSATQSERGEAGQGGAWYAAARAG